jgi:hypothetical protein
MPTPSFNKKYDAAVKRSQRLAYLELSSIYADIKRVATLQSPEQALSHLNNIHPERFKNLAAKIYEKEGATFYLWQQSNFERKKDFVGRDFQVGFFSEIWKAIMRDVLSNSLLLIRFSKMAETTRNDIRKILIAGINGNMSKVDIGRLISEQIGYIKHRALRIARTETTYAASLGTTQAAKNSVLPLVKVWTHGGGGKEPRQHHIALGGVTVGKNDFFNVNGKNMLYPGDSNGGVEEVVNCTCNVTYIVDESRLN